MGQICLDGYSFKICPFFQLWTIIVTIFQMAKSKTIWFLETSFQLKSEYVCRISVGKFWGATGGAKSGPDFNTLSTHLDKSSPGPQPPSGPQELYILILPTYSDSNWKEVSKNHIVFDFAIWKMVKIMVQSWQKVSSL